MANNVKNNATSTANLDNPISAIMASFMSLIVKMTAYKNNGGNEETETAKESKESLAARKLYNARLDELAKTDATATALFALIVPVDSFRVWKAEAVNMLDSAREASFAAGKPSEEYTSMAFQLERFAHKFPQTRKTTAKTTAAKVLGSIAS